MVLRLARVCLARSPIARGGLASNLLWLVFALSFLWFPYIGMWVFPCKQKGDKEHKHHSSSWSKYGTIDELVDYTKTESMSTENYTIEDIIKDQKKRLYSFCAAHNMPSTVYSEASARDLFHHILVDDKRKLLFCYIPKVGCSNWKRVFLILAGIVDHTQKSRPSIEVFRQVNSLENYSPKEREYRLRNYFKFMFIRYPPERVLSAYRNKIEHPLITDPVEQSIWDEVRYSVLNAYRMNFNVKMAREQDDVYPTFSEFVHFLYDSDPIEMNEHYKPMFELCQPCAIDYDYVGNFGSIRSDADAILNHLSIDPSLFWDRGKRNTPTTSYVQKYYSTLQPVDFRRLEERFGSDLALYEYLFPSTGDPHYRMLRDAKL